MEVDCNEERKEKKTKRNISEVEKLIKEYANNFNIKSTKIRYMTIQCGLKGACINQNDLEIIQANCISVGCRRTIISLFSNYFAFKRINQNLNPVPLMKQSYDRFWSVLDCMSRGETMKTREWDDFNSDDVFRSMTNFLLNAGIDPKELPPPVMFEVRSPTTRDMQTSAREHIKRNCYGYVKRFVLQKIDNLKCKRGNNKYRLVKAIQALVLKEKIRDLSDNDHLMKVINQDKWNYDDIKSILYDTWELLNIGHLWCENIKGIDKKGLNAMLKNRPHLIMKSLKIMSDFLEDNFINAVEEFETKDIGGHLDFDTDGLGDINDEDIKIRSETFKKLPKAGFNLLPVWKFTPASIELAYTQLCTLFGKNRVNVKDLREGLFNIGKIPQSWSMDKFLNKVKNAPPVFVTSFITNGYQLNVKFIKLEAVSPSYRGSNELPQSRMNFLKFTKLINEKTVILNHGFFIY